VRLAGLAGLIGGAFSMAAGEYVSMRAQRELLERELDVERRAIHSEPVAERRELARLYESRGVEPELAHELAERMMENPEVALEIHAREELGVDPGELGNPLQTAISSFLTFAVGAVLPLLPWLFSGGTGTLVASVAVAAVASLVVGGVLSIFTGRSWAWAAVRQLLISGAAAGVTYSIGVVIGA
jgi:VIT1/CCC1 family predicted Fe2+/Mn2+ transporter